MLEFQSLALLYAPVALGFTSYMRGDERMVMQKES